MDRKDFIKMDSEDDQCKEDFSENYEIFVKKRYSAFDIKKDRKDLNQLTIEEGIKKTIREGDEKDIGVFENNRWDIGEIKREAGEDEKDRIKLERDTVKSSGELVWRTRRTSQRSARRRKVQENMRSPLKQNLQFTLRLFKTDIHLHFLLFLNPLSVTTQEIIIHCRIGQHGLFFYL